MFLIEGRSTSSLPDEQDCFLAVEIVNDRGVKLVLTRRTYGSARWSGDELGDIELSEAGRKELLKALS